MLEKLNLNLYCSIKGFFKPKPPPATCNNNINFFKNFKALKIAGFNFSFLSKSAFIKYVYLNFLTFLNFPFLFDLDIIAFSAPLFANV